MKLEDIREVNDAFREMYPFLAQQMAAAYGRDEGLALEIGPYGPGISIELARLRPRLRFVVGDDDPAVNDYLRAKVAEAGLAERIAVRTVDKYALPFADETVDLVMFRGGLFFWPDEAAILRQVARVLRPGGVGVVGGGFGAEAPDALIETVAGRVRELNRRLGKKTFSPSQVEALIREAGLDDCTEVDYRHGLWLVIMKGGSRAHQ